jgi:hypothetical protein
MVAYAAVKDFPWWHAWSLSNPTCSVVLLKADAVVIDKIFFLKHLVETKFLYRTSQKGLSMDGNSFTGGGWGRVISSSFSALGSNTPRGRGLACAHCGRYVATAVQGAACVCEW